ncbi:hypothetical protein CASFOL_015987 [Castilleja foliolosa]|uniref:FAD-binding domain-containing protein n=1 Tax=Castilleja foliolosa TaxID=1961234 RepID=A0ABD3DJ16_9LAMI
MDIAINQDIVIVGAGLAGLTTALGLHRLGLKCVVLESSDRLRVTGHALTLWSNAWRALDAVGVGDNLRQRSARILGFKIASHRSSLPVPDADIDFDKVEVRCVRRKDLLETLENELPQGVIRYSSKVVSIEESEDFKLIHLSDGLVVRTKALIGCDGVNSKVAKWLGLQSPVQTGRSAIRGFVDYPNGHGFEPKFHTYFGGGLRCGFIPCDDRSIYWFCTFRQSDFEPYDENEQNPLEMKQFVLNSILNAPKQISDVIERTELDCITYVPLKFRLPWNVLFGNIVKDNVCVAGDALHPMPPDIGQGGCSSLEDGVVLAKCIGHALLAKSTANVKDGDDEHLRKIGKGLKNYSRQRRWRSFSLISTAYVVGLVQESDSMVMSFLRKTFLSKLTIGTVVRMADYDCGKLV